MRTAEVTYDLTRTEDITTRTPPPPPDQTVSEAERKQSSINKSMNTSDF